MSNVSNRHTFVTLEKNTRALHGQRLVRLIAKKNKEDKYENPNLTQSLAVSVPPLSHDVIVENIERLIPHVAAYIESIQDTLIREYRISSGHDSIDESEFDIDHVIAHLESNVGGTRLTKEYLSKWFEETYSESAARFIAQSLSFPMSLNEWSAQQAEVIETKVNVLRDMFAGFAGARYSPSIPQCRAMSRFVSYLGEDADARLVSFGARAEAIRKQKESEMSMDALGF